jgi:hypothetical protein
MIGPDTSTAMATLIGYWLNDKYHDIWKRCAWSETINENYTFATVANTQHYDLPNDFEEELFLADITDGVTIQRYTEAYWWRDRAEAFSGGSITSSTNPTRYAILREKTKTTYSQEEGFGQIKLDPTPSAIHTFAMPYKRRCVDLFTNVTGTADTNTLNKVIASGSTFITSGIKSGMRVKNTTDSIRGYIVSVDSETQLTCDTDVCPDGNEAFTIETDTPIISDISFILECGAESEAHIYKRNFQKASALLDKYEYELGKRIKQERGRMNQLYQMTPEPRGYSAVMPFTGWNSYDTV